MTHEEMQSYDSVEAHMTEAFDHKVGSTEEDSEHWSSQDTHELERAEIAIDSLLSHGTTPAGPVPTEPDELLDSTDKELGLGAFVHRAVSSPTEELPALASAHIDEHIDDMPRSEGRAGTKSPPLANNGDTDDTGVPRAQVRRPTMDPLRVCIQCGRDYFNSESNCSADKRPLYPVLNSRNWNNDDLVGRVFDGRYLIKGVIGEGGVGTVLQAWHVYLDRTVAIKLTHPRWMHMSGLRDRFLREARALASMNHPNVVEVQDFRTMPDGLDYLVMELLEGEDLSKWLDSHGPMLSPDIAQVAVQTCNALQHMHDLGFIHRDLKPGNLWVDRTPSGRLKLKLLDFGAAGLLQDAQQERFPRLTAVGEILGTISYMSPEQCQGQSMGGPTDLYSLCCVLWELLVGHKPHRGKSPLETMKKHQNEPTALPSTHGAHVDPALEAIIMKGLEKRPEDRWSRAADMAGALELWLSRSRRMPERPKGAIHRARRFAKDCLQKQSHGEPT